MLPRCLHGLRLRPRRHAEQQHLTQRPDVIRQASGHGRRPRLPALGRAVAMGRLGFRERLAQAGMRQAEIVVCVVEYQLLPQTVLALTQRHDAPPNRRHMLADTEVDALDEGRIDLPAAHRQDLLHRRLGAEDHAVCHLDQAPPARDLDHLRIEQLRQGHPTWLGQGAFDLTALRLYPVAEMRQQRRDVLLKAVGQKDWHTVRGQHLDDLMHDTLGHR